MTDEETLHQINQVGRLLFGKPGRMTLGMFCSMNQGTDVTYADYRDWCRTHGPMPALATLRPDISRFIALGMVDAVTARGGQRSVLYHVARHHLWTAFQNVLGAHLLAQIGGSLREPQVDPELALQNLRVLEARFR